ncbi:hypothetical protein, partial [Tolumonas lignilytica]|uniref:hypothetical protein n=1 Tax=Tolumonas lignilytica TaxID=1283284 RepID=UPI000465D581
MLPLHLLQTTARNYPPTGLKLPVYFVFHRHHSGNGQWLPQTICPDDEPLQAYTPTDLKVSEDITSAELNYTP